MWTILKDVIHLKKRAENIIGKGEKWPLKSTFSKIFQKSSPADASKVEKGNFKECN